MTNEDITRMAREAGLEDGWAGWCQECGCDSDKLTRFAALVVAAEREACAKLAEITVCDTHLPTGYKIHGTRVAKAIREKSTP